MKRSQSTSLFQGGMAKTALIESFVKLNPAVMYRNPVMFTVEIGTVVMLIVCLQIAFGGDTTQGSLAYNIVIFTVLFLTLLFANFAEAIAEARGKAQADSLRKTREETPAKVIRTLGRLKVNELQIIPSSQLEKGDVFVCDAGDIIPTDGEIIEGLATIDESAITGEENLPQ